MSACFLDESKDAAKREGLALAVRYSAGNVVKRFVYLRKLDQFDAQAIKECVNELIKCIIQSSGSSMVICLGADGASVIAGEFSGVAELLRSDYFHWLIYIHCTAHRISLLVNDLIKGSNLALDIFSKNNSLHALLNHEKVREVYHTAYSEYAV